MSQFSAPSRKAYLREQRERHGRHPFGVFPARTKSSVAAAQRSCPSALAVRAVVPLSLTSTMRARPASSR